MEGPSLFLAAEQLAPFVGKTIQTVSGNTKIGKERLADLQVLNIYACGKHLVFQFAEFALRVHFMLYGSFEALVKGKQVTGDYPRKSRPPRLELVFENGQIDMFSCSLKYLETAQAKDLYDYTIDIMSPFWDSQKALNTIKQYPDSEIGDLLLDQTIFAGVGNIIKNETLFLVKRAPTALIHELSVAKLRQIISTAHKYSAQFYRWRKKFVLSKHYRIYRMSLCPRCQGKVTRRKTGVRRRFSFFCLHCQK